MPLSDNSICPWSFEDIVGTTYMARKEAMDIVSGGGKEARIDEVGSSSSLPCGGYARVSENVARIA